MRIKQAIAAGEVLVDSSAEDLKDMVIRDKWKQLAPSLMDALKSNDPWPAAAAVAVLGDLGPEAAADSDAST